MLKVIVLISYVIVGLALAALALGIAGLLWWTGEGYCVGTMAHCVRLP